MEKVEEPNRDGTRYKEIEAWLEGLCGAASVGQALPTEQAVAAKFDVSRMTARRAFQGLVQRGLVVRRRGSGTFVAPRSMHRVEEELLSFSEEMRRRGKTPSSRLLFAGVAVSPRDAVALDLSASEPLVQIQRVRLADGAPLAIEEVMMPIEFSPVLDLDLEVQSLYAALLELGAEPVRMTGYVASRLADERECELLGTEPPTSLLIESRVVTDDSGRKISISETAYRADNWVIDISAANFSSRGSQREQ